MYISCSGESGNEASITKANYTDFDFTLVLYPDPAEHETDFTLSQRMEAVDRHNVIIC